MSTPSVSDRTLMSPAGTLTVTAPSRTAGTSAAVGAAPTVIGRDENSALVLAHSSVSRKHAVVHYQDGEFRIEDLRSSNGTQVNGVRATSPTILRDNDRLTLGDVQVVFHTVHPPVAPRPEQAQARGSEPASLLQSLHDAPGFSLRGLALAVGGSVVGTVLTGALAQEPWGTLAAAAILPIVAATFANHGATEPKRVQAAAIAILSTAALAVTMTGFDVADTFAGRALVGQGDSTFPRPKAKSTTMDAPQPTDTPTGGAEPKPSPSASATPGLGVDVAPRILDCGEVATGASRDCPQTITITSSGTEPLQIRSVQITGANADDFRVDGRCVGQSLEADESCMMTVSFRPHTTGGRTATLTIHQNMPSPDRGTPVALTGTGQKSEPGR
jgi:hypothetical protein